MKIIGLTLDNFDFVVDAFELIGAVTMISTKNGTVDNYDLDKFASLWLAGL